MQSIAKFLILVFILGFSAAALADEISGTTGGPQSWSASTLSSPGGTPYWSGLSGDGSGMGIGSCMSGTGNCNMSGAPGFLPYWGNADGTPDLNIQFTPTGGSITALQIELAGFANLNQFGYLDATGYHILFTGPQGSGTVASVAAVGSYVFFLVSGNGQTYFTNSALNPVPDQQVQHFVVFLGSTPGTYWIGAEDLSGIHTDADYNDLVVKVTPVPEPGSMLLLGSGLLGALGAARRKLLG